MPYIELTPNEQGNVLRSDVPLNVAVVLSGG